PAAASVALTCRAGAASIRSVSSATSRAAVSAVVRSCLEGGPAASAADSNDIAEDRVLTVAATVEQRRLRVIDHAAGTPGTHIALDNGSWCDRDTGLPHHTARTATATPDCVRCPVDRRTAAPAAGHDEHVVRGNPRWRAPRKGADVCHDLVLD